MAGWARLTQPRSAEIEDVPCQLGNVCGLRVQHVEARQRAKRISAREDTMVVQQDSPDVGGKRAGDRGPMRVGSANRLPVSSACITLRRELEPQSAGHDVGGRTKGEVELSRSLLITSGAGEARTEPAAFDAALLSAGVGNFNLIRLNSVIPTGSMIVKK